jgi:hypothetical protein
VPLPVAVRCVGAAVQLPVVVVVGDLSLKEVVVAVGVELELETHVDQ